MIYLCECCLQFSELSCIVLILTSQQLDLGLEFLILLAAIGHSVFELFNVVLKVLYFLGVFHFHRLFHFLISFGINVPFESDPYALLLSPFIDLSITFESSYACVRHSNCHFPINNENECPSLSWNLSKVLSLDQMLRLREK